MDYKEKYEQALKRAETLIEKLESNHIKGFIYHIFPELIENKDEKIKKAIIAYINHGQHCGVSNADMITWLEKQCKTHNTDLLTKVLAKHLYTCVNKTNTYVRSAEDHISLTDLITKIVLELNIE